MGFVELVKVDMLGDFTVTAILQDGTEHCLTERLGRSRKLWTLLEYLVVHRERCVTQEELIELLWPEGGVENAVGSLKLIIHRLRNGMEIGSVLPGRQIIVNRRGSYIWGDTFPTVVDADEFEELCQYAADCPDTERQLEYMLRALLLYRGNFLSRSTGSAWVASLSSYYQSLYIHVCMTAIPLLEAQERSEEIAELCCRAIEIAPGEEKLHLALIHALAAQGKSRDALDQYNKTTQLLLTQFGSTPTEEFTSIYKELLRKTHSPESDLSVVRARLAEADALPGAFYCEYEFFKEIYRQRVRESARSGQPVQLALITLSGSKNRELTQKQTGTLMERLCDTIRESLRAGDVFARFSARQFLLLLPSTSLEHMDIILGRIRRNFRSRSPGARAVLQATSLPINPQS